LLTKTLGQKVKLVGDDLFATNSRRLQKGIDLGAANAVLIKVNQIGTLSETFDTVLAARANGYATIRRKWKTSDRISLTVTGDEAVFDATVAHRDHLVRETLATQFGSSPNLDDLAAGDGAADVTVGDGHPARVLVRKV